MLLLQGQVCKYYYFVNKGCIRLFTINDDGQEATRYFAFEGGFGSALPSLIQKKPAFEFVQAIEKSELLAIAVRCKLKVLSCSTFSFVGQQRNTHKHCGNGGDYSGTILLFLLTCNNRKFYFDHCLGRIKSFNLQPCRCRKISVIVFFTNFF